jgi:hypothetical protein
LYQAITGDCLTSFNPLDCKQLKAFTLDPSVWDNLTRVRVVIGHFRPIVVAIVPVLANGTFRGAESHYASRFELDFIA